MSESEGSEGREELERMQAGATSCAEPFDGKEWLTNYFGRSQDALEYRSFRLRRLTIRGQVKGLKGGLRLTRRFM